MKEVQFDRLGCFAYSAEENTVAAKMDGQIEQEVKDKRAELVMQIQTGIMAQKQAAMSACPAKSRSTPASSMTCWWRTATFTICMVLS